MQPDRATLVPSPARGRLARLWSRLVEPSPLIVGVDAQRQVRLLAGLTLALSCTTTLGFLAATAAGKLVNGPLTALFVGLYFISRTRRPHLGAHVLIAALAAGIFVAVPLSGEYGRTGLTANLSWLVLSLICGQIFLRTRGLVVLVAAELLAILCLPLVLPVALPDVLAAFGHLLTTGALLLVFQRHRDLVERDHLAELAAVNHDLAREVTARQEALADAEAANEAKSRFLANMSHELRTPLNAVIGYVELVLEEDAEDRRLSGDARRSLDRALVASRHLLTIIGDILDLAKIEASKLEPVLQDIDIADLVDQLRDLVRPLVAENGNTLAVDCPATGRLHTDAVRLRQCLLNLLSNACKFTRNGRIDLSVRADADTLAFAVSDTGMGISHKNLATLFEPFVQGDNSPTRRHGGTGLGLALTRQLAQMLGGDVTVKSAVDRGSTFTLTIPRRYSAPDPRSSGPRSRHGREPSLPHAGAPGR